MSIRKFFLTIVLLPFALQAAEVDSKKISKALDVVEKYVHGVAVHKVRGKDVEAMLRDLGERINGSEEMTIVNYPAEVPEIDSGSNEYGLCRLVQARDLSLLEYDPHSERSKEELRNAEKKVHDAFWAMKEAGAKFGYTTDGSSVCGVTWPSPLVIDTKAKKIYEILLVGGPC